jgi:hypothetical protein
MLAPFKAIHGGCAPRSREILSGPANEHAFAVASTDTESKFLDGRHDRHTLRLIQQFLRQGVGNVEDFFHGLGAAIEPFVFRIARKQWHDHQQA